MAQYMNSNFELAGPLAGLFGGIQQGQEEERQRLANVYQDLQNQRYGGMTPNEVAKSNLEGALATGKLEGGYVPEAVKAAVGEQQAKAQEFDLEKGLSNIELARTALDAGMAPDAVAQRFNVNLDTPFGQAYLKDPHGTLDHVYDKMIKRRSDTVKQRQAVELQNLKDDADLKRAQLSASTSLQGQKYAADRGLTGSMLGYAKDLRGELDNINTNITKLEGKEMDTAIFDAFRQSGKTNATQADVDKYKSEQLTALRNRKTEVENDLSEARGAVRGRIGLGQGAGTQQQPIKLK